MSQAQHVASTGSAGHAAVEDRTALVNHVSFALYQLFGSTQFIEHLSVKPTRDFAALKPRSKVSHGYVLYECAKAARADPRAFESTITDVLLAADKAFDTRALLSVGLTLSELWKLPRFDPRRRDDNRIGEHEAQNLLRVPTDFQVFILPFTKTVQDLMAHIESLTSEDAFFVDFQMSNSQLEALHFATTRSQCYIVDARACTVEDLGKIETAASGALCAKFGLTDGWSMLPVDVAQLMRGTDDILTFVSQMFKQQTTDYENLVQQVLGKCLPSDASESMWNTRPFSVRQIRHCTTKVAAAIQMLVAAKRRFPNAYRRKWSLLQDAVYSMYK